MIGVVVAIRVGGETGGIVHHVAHVRDLYPGLHGGENRISRRFVRSRCEFHVLGKGDCGQGGEHR